VSQDEDVNTAGLTAILGLLFIVWILRALFIRADNTK